MAGRHSLGLLNMKSTAVLDDKSILIVTGPTASGKTAFAVRCAKNLNGEIISADSRQIYRYLNIGTAKPSNRQQRAVRHHLIDFLDPDSIFDAGTFVRLANQSIADIQKRGKRPIIVGGTGLYIKALVDGLAPLPRRDENIRAKLNAIIKKKGLQSLYNWLAKIDTETSRNIDPYNPARIIRAMEVYLLTGKGMAYFHKKTKKSEHSFTMIGLNPPKKTLMSKIIKRTEAMVKGGMIEETKRLLNRGFKPTCPACLSLGYRHVIKYLNGTIDKENLKQSIITDTWQYAKRQKTWFKKDKRIIWLSKTSSINLLSILS